MFALPNTWASNSSSIARLPPARADSADVLDNLVIDYEISAFVFKRRFAAGGQLEFVCPWWLAPTDVRARTSAKRPVPVKAFTTY